MKMYNKNNGKIVELPKTLVVDGVVRYTNKMTEAQLNEVGYYKIARKSKPNKRYYTFVEFGELVDNKYVIDYVVTERDVEQVKVEMLKCVSTSFKQVASRPEVVTSLGFSVDGGLNDIQLLEIGREMGVPFITGADGIQHAVEPEDYSTIVLEIKAFGLNLFTKKWNKGKLIKTFTTVDECILFEKESYEVEVPVLDENEDEVLDEDGNVVMETVTKYKNNCTDWS